MSSKSAAYYRRNRRDRMRVHRCPHCIYETTGPKQCLAVHISARHKPEAQRPYQCDHCTRGFAQFAHLSKHLFQAHDIKPQPKKKMSALGYFITPTAREPGSYRTRARKAYYLQHSLVRSRDLGALHHEYLPGLFLKPHDIRYDRARGFVKIQYSKLVGNICHLGKKKLHVRIKEHHSHVRGGEKL